MEPSQTDPAIPQPKKHRMTFAEWRQANPNYEPTPEEEALFNSLAEYVGQLLESASDWFHEVQAETRRKKYHARPKQTKMKSASRRKNRRARTPAI